MNLIKKEYFILSLIVVALFTIGSCRYNEVVDVPYPEQKIYLPAATYGVFRIDELNEYHEDLPLPGGNYRYIIDTNKNKFIVPLGVYRSGADNNGTFKIQISNGAQKVIDLQNKGELSNNVNIIDKGHISIPESVRMEDGKEIAGFNLEIDLGYLINNLANDFVVGVSITSDSRKTSKGLDTAIIYISSKLFIPQAAFSYEVSNANSFKINFKNQSEFGGSFIWDFGDGSSLSYEENPSHLFKSYGHHEVTLTVISIAGSKLKSIKKKVITL